MSNSTIFPVNADSVAPYPGVIAMARGLYPDHETVTKFGRIIVPTLNTQTDIWSGASTGFLSYPYFSEASKLEIASSSAEDDNDGGTGIKTLVIEGLDANYDKLTELITLEGTTPVTTTNSFLRTFRMYGVTCGTAESNVGNIWAIGIAGTWVAGVPQENTYKQAVIGIGRGQTEMALYTIPNGYTGYLTLIGASISKASNKYGDVEIWARAYSATSNNNRGPWRSQVFLGLSATGNTTVTLGNSLTPTALPSKIDVKATIDANFTASSVMCRFALLLVKG